MQHRDSVHKVLRGSQLELLGDARYDSPGYSAKFCTYTLMAGNGLVVDYELVQVSQTKKKTTTVAQWKKQAFNVYLIDY